MNKAAGTGSRCATMDKPSQTYSNKWGWQFSQQPFVPYPVTDRLEPYKKSGPGTSEMYRKAFPSITYDQYVNNLGDL